RPIPGFPAARAAAAAAPIPLGGTASFANGAGTGDAAPSAAGASFAGPPRAEIPVGFSPGAGFTEDLELSGAPDRPLPQRLQFGSGGGTDFPFPAQAGAGVADQSAEGVPESGGALPSPETIGDL